MNKYGLETLALIALIGSMALWGFAAKQPALKAAPVKATPNKGYLKEVSVDGEDIAKVLQLPVYKWKLRFPPGTTNLVFWVEDWRKGNPRPNIIGLFSTAVQPGATAASAEPAPLLIKLPDARDNRFIVSVSGTTSSAILPGLVINSAQGGAGTGGSSSRPVFAGDNILLAGTIQNKNGLVQATYEPEQIVRNDRTLLFKLHLSNTAGTALPMWENGKVVVKNL